LQVVFGGFHGHPHQSQGGAAGEQAAKAAFAAHTAHEKIAQHLFGVKHVWTPWVIFG
jgi:ribulose 1,5-bisphosphate carboxylase large subunit-like protein